MSNANAMLLFIVIVVSYLSLGAVILAAAHRLDRQRQQEIQDLATLHRQVSTTQRSVFYLEGMVRLARGEVAEEEEEDADLFVTR